MSRLALPTWLLRTFGSGPSVDALVGDLVEEHQRGRSAWWFWRQAILGIVVTFIAALRAHPITTAAAVSSGWALLWGTSQVVSYSAIRIIVVMEVYVPWLAPYLALTSDGRLVVWNLLVQMLITAIAAGLAGFLLAAAFRRQQVVAVLAWVVSSSVWMFYLSIVATPPLLPPGAAWMEVSSWDAAANAMFPIVHVTAQLAGGMAVRHDTQRAAHGAIAGR